jgi:hypothetical protein
MATGGNDSGKPGAFVKRAGTRGVFRKILFESLPTASSFASEVEPDVRASVLFFRLETINKDAIARAEKIRAEALAALYDGTTTAEDLGVRLIQLGSDDEVKPDQYLLALVEAAPSSATGKCPHSIGFPSVARSSLTWSRCFVCPLCGCWCRG